MRYFEIIESEPPTPADRMKANAKQQKKSADRLSATASLLQAEENLKKSRARWRTLIGLIDRRSSLLRAAQREGDTNHGSAPERQNRPRHRLDRWHRPRDRPQARRRRRQGDRH